MIKAYKISYLLGTGLLLISLILRINHLQYFNVFFIFGFIFSLPYIFIALDKIYKSSKTLIEKFVWLIFFILLPFIAGIIFYNDYLKNRK